MSEKKPPEIYFSQPARYDQRSRKFSVEVIKNNGIGGICTQLLLDANVLIAMDDKVIQSLDSDCLNLEEIICLSGLSPLVNVLREAENHVSFIEIIPGAALGEFTPARKYQRRQAFDRFLHLILPDKYVDAPNSVATPVSVDNTRLAFRDLPSSRRNTLAISYYSLLLIQLIMFKHDKLSPLEKVSLYLYRSIKQINHISALELEIAKLCFCDRKNKYSDIFNLFASDIRENFFQPSGKSGQRFHNALNGARDLYYLRLSEIIMTDTTINNYLSDTWLVTMDRKLYRASEAFQQVILDNGSSTPFVAIDRKVELNDHKYWKDVDRISDKAFQNRLANGILTRTMSDTQFSELIIRTEGAIALIENEFEVSLIYI